jgi:DeoR family transcriptional regulator, ulaG and ulaABCDEF operon transcriptional repressor
MVDPVAFASRPAPGEAVMIDGGYTTLQMCQHVRGLNLQVLTNSLRIVSTLLLQPGTRVLAPPARYFRNKISSSPHSVTTVCSAFTRQNFS